MLRSESGWCLQYKAESNRAPFLFCLFPVVLATTVPSPRLREIGARSPRDLVSAPQACDVVRFKVGSFASQIGGGIPL